MRAHCSAHTWTRRCFSGRACATMMHWAAKTRHGGKIGKIKRAARVPVLWYSARGICSLAPHSLLVSIDSMLRDQAPYHDLGPDHAHLLPARRLKRQWRLTPGGLRLSGATDAGAITDRWRRLVHNSQSSGPRAGERCPLSTPGEPVNFQAKRDVGARHGSG